MTLVPSPHNGLRYRIEVWVETWKDPARWPGRTGWKPSTNSTTRTIPRRRKKIRSTDAQEFRSSPRPSGLNENAARVGGVVCRKL